MFSFDLKLNTLLICLFSPDVLDSDPERSLGFSFHQLSPVLQLPQASLTPTELSHGRSFKSISSTPTRPHCKSPCDQSVRCSPCPEPIDRPDSEKLLSIRRSSKTAENVKPDTSTDLAFSQFLFPDRECAMLELSPVTSSPRLSPLRTSPRSASGAKLTPASPPYWLESQRWPVLPPISPVGGER